MPPVDREAPVADERIVDVEREARPRPHPHAGKARGHEVLAAELRHAIVGVGTRAVLDDELRVLEHDADRFRVVGTARRGAERERRHEGEGPQPGR